MLDLIINSQIERRTISLPNYQIRGVTFEGVVVDESVQAPTEKAALRYIFFKYGRLKNPYDIFVTSQIEDVSQIPSANMLRPIDPLLSDEDVIRIGIMLKSNKHVDEEEKKRFDAYFRPMIRRAVRDLWNDITISTRDDIAQEMYEYIIMEFLPKYSSQRVGIRKFIQTRVESRLKKKWKREKYINADNNASSHPKHEILKKYARSLPDITVEDINQEDERKKILEICIKVVINQMKLSVSQRRALFQRIVRLNLHKEFLRRKKQIQVLEIVYGQENLTEVKAAASLGITQQTLNTNKNRAERNFFNYIEKYFIEDR